MKKAFYSLVLAGLIGLIVVPLYAQQASSILVIVNSSNTQSSLTKADIINIFMKKQTIWQDGQKIVPVDLPVTSSVRAKFSKEFLDKSVIAVASHWRSKLFAGLSVPPLVKRTEKEIIAYVAENDGAIGYVSRSALTDTDIIKIVKIAD